MFTDFSESSNRIAQCFQIPLKASNESNGQFITSFFLYLNQMVCSEKSDDADAIVLSIKNVRKSCKDANKSACCAGYVRSIYATASPLQMVLPCGAATSAKRPV